MTVPLGDVKRSNAPPNHSMLTAPPAGCWAGAVEPTAAKRSAATATEASMAVTRSPNIEHLLIGTRVGAPGPSVPRGPECRAVARPAASAAPAYIRPPPCARIDLLGSARAVPARPG